MSRGQKALIRQWSLIEALVESKRGRTVPQLKEETGASRATVYRDLAVLREAGIPVDSHNVNGEARVSLYAERRIPPLSPTPLQIAAIRLARRALDGLAGTRVVAELDALLAGYGSASDGNIGVSFASRPASAPNLVAKLDRAVLGGRRCRIRYRGARDDAPRWRLLDPVALRWVKGHIYLVAYDGDSARAEPKTFKTDRITAVDVLPDKAAARPQYDERAFFAHSVKAWTGEEVDASVRLSLRVARFASEYPLAGDQQATGQPDGSVVIHARVAGIPEAMRWVLAWGQDAEALAPEALRQAVLTELDGATRRYAKQRRPRLRRVVSSDRETGAA